MPYVVDCPLCERPLRVPDALLGQRVKCPTCGGAFDAEPAPPPSEAPLQAVETPPAPQPEPAPRPEAAPQRHHPDDDWRRCPHCGEEVRERWSRCRACGEDLDETRAFEDDPRFRRRARRDWEPHRSGLVLALGILSTVTIVAYPCAVIGLPLGIAAWAMGQADLKKMRQNVMDPEGRGSTQAGWVCGIIGTVITSLYALGCGAMIAWSVTESAAANKRVPAPTPVPAPVPAAPNKR
jgi:hypothetical protein